MPISPTPDELHLVPLEADAAARRLQRKLGLPLADLDDLRQELLTDLIAGHRGYTGLHPSRGRYDASNQREA